MEITEELIQQRTDKYIDDNISDILAEIDRRIATAINKSIREYFSGRNWNKTEIQLYIEGRIEELAVTEVKAVEIDTAEINRLVNKKINQQVKRINVTIGE